MDPDGLAMGEVYPQPVFEVGIGGGGLGLLGGIRAPRVGLIGEPDVRTLVPAPDRDKVLELLFGDDNKSSSCPVLQDPSNYYPYGPFIHPDLLQESETWPGVWQTVK
jgi:hypothetical protein